MSKVAVGRSVARAYGFLFGRIFTVLGTAWMGAVLYAGLALVMIREIPAMQNIREAALAGLAEAALWHLAVVLASFLVMASIAIPLTREALDEGGEFVFAQFVLGAREMRYFLAVIRLGVIVIAVLAVGTFAAAEIPAAAKLLVAHWPGLQAQFDHWPIVHGVQIGICALAFLITLTVALRFGFLLKAVAAVERHASLLRAWTLSRGNTLRILMVVLLAVIPAYVVLFAVAYAFLGQPLLDAYRDAFAAGAAKPVAALLALYAAHGVAFGCLAALKLLLLVGLMAGASAEAYRTLTADEDDSAMHEGAAHNHHEERHHDEHHQEPAHHHHDEDHGEHEAQTAEDQGHDEHGHEASRHAEDVQAPYDGHAPEYDHEEPENHPQELALEEATENHVSHVLADGGHGDESAQQAAADFAEPVRQSYQYEHDDDERCDCQTHAMPEHALDDPHDVHVIEPKPDEAASLPVAAGEPVLADEPVHGGGGENIPVLEPA